eukprot:8377240-Alexandrium_andersonii.AAC.1
MSASLVGSEMCIRDRAGSSQHHSLGNMATRIDAVHHWRSEGGWNPPVRPVSYTHLTLPTICSV